MLYLLLWAFLAPSSIQAAALSHEGHPTTDGTCGTKNGASCFGFAQGNCCSEYGWCGFSSQHCGAGCQPGFGHCFAEAPESPIYSAPHKSSTVSSAYEKPTSYGKPSPTHYPKPSHSTPGYHTSIPKSTYHGPESSYHVSESSYHPIVSEYPQPSPSEYEHIPHSESSYSYKTPTSIYVHPTSSKVPVYSKPTPSCSTPVYSTPSPVCNKPHTVHHTHTVTVTHAETETVCHTPYHTPSVYEAPTSETGEYEAVETGWAGDEE